MGFEIIFILIVFGSILFLTYITTRYIAAKSSKALKGKHINIVETVNLGMDKRIHLIKVGDQYFLISSTSKNIGFLTTASIEDNEEINDIIQPNAQNVFDFRAFFEKYMNSYKNIKGNIFKQNNNNETSISQTEVESFKTNLGKLKSITQKINKQS